MCVHHSLLNDIQGEMLNKRYRSKPRRIWGWIENIRDNLTDLCASAITSLKVINSLFNLVSECTLKRPLFKPIDKIA